MENRTRRIGEMKEAPKYTAPEPIDLPDRQWPSRSIVVSPEWCSVDLRDGNQALPNPMNPEQKLEYFELLYTIGFKQIEVGFPSASQDDFDFVRRLIEEGHIPDDVTIMVLTQCRPELITRTMESIQGAERVIVHIYIATSELHMQQVFAMDQQATIEVAVQAARQVREAVALVRGCDINLEFSPEEFTDTDITFALRICKAVFEEWGQATTVKPMILNLPATVERRPPYQVADMFEWFGRHFPYRDRVKISTHAHNDQGMAVASTEMAVLAGADRVEVALFGNGERTGNVAGEIVALNLSFRGIDVGLDFSNLPEIAETVERLTGMPVPPRHPYAGDLVTTAFSGSHQDAIRKTMARLAEAATRFLVGWKVAYLPFDPQDLGREYRRMVRINSQSGKGGIAWVMEREFGVILPRVFQSVLGQVVQIRTDATGGEVSSAQLMAWFREEFIEPTEPYELVGYWVEDDAVSEEITHGTVKIIIDGVLRAVSADGNGPIDAFAKALDQLDINGGFEVAHDFSEGSLGLGSAATGIAFMPLTFDGDETVWWGVGTHKKTHVAAARGIVAALNRRARQAATV